MPSSLPASQTTHDHVRGYIEGYYGKLLSWEERSRIIDSLSNLDMTHYAYAPKEDERHRLHWREPYDLSWRDNFKRLCDQAYKHEITVLAGIAPGLDFDFAHLDFAQRGDGSDFTRLVQKARQLRGDGADSIMLLMDDIDEAFVAHRGDFDSEGKAHAELCNRLSEELQEPCIVVPRVYANELASGSENYVPDFVSTLSAEQTLVYCGKSIVADKPMVDDYLELLPDNHSHSKKAQHRVVIWDNLYANDYCPRRLFTCAWTGRDNCRDILLNPTGMIETDLLLLELMAHSTKDNTTTLGQLEEIRFAVLKQHGVPDCFSEVAEHFNNPQVSGTEPTTLSSPGSLQRESVEHLLWKWKSPLSREWYPFLMGLRQDLALSSRDMELERLHKSQPPALAGLLLNQFDE